jgi:hypothetical protein
MASLVWNAIDHMNEARANKPASGGKAYPRRALRQSDLNAMYPAESLDRLEWWFADWRLGIEQRCLNAVESALFPEQYEEFR